MTTSAGRARRVLICEDSKTYALGLTRLLEYDHELKVVAVCESAEKALACLEALKPDLVTMDLELPGMSGVEAIEQIMSAFPVPILVLSGHVEHRSQTALLALAAGALDAIAKHDLDFAEPGGAAAKALRQRAKLLIGVKVIRHPRARLREAISPMGRHHPASMIGICASTGGPPALAVLLGDMPPTFAIPILVVQHIAAGFVAGFADWLDTQVQLQVGLAEDGAEAAAGVWIAPEGHHLVVCGGGRFALASEPAESRHRPSGDVLLRSLAATCGRNAVAVVLTGMGRDGAEGLAACQRAGGLTIAQDEPTSAVFGMPRAAAESGAELVLPLADIAPQLRTLRPVAVSS